MKTAKKLVLPLVALVMMMSAMYLGSPGRLPTTTGHGSNPHVVR